MQGFSPGLSLTRNRTQVYAKVFPLQSTPASFEGGLAHESSAETAAMHGFRIAEHPRVHRFRKAERPRPIGGRTLLRKRERRRAMDGSPEDPVFRRRDGGKRISREGGEMGGRCREVAHKSTHKSFRCGRARCHWSHFKAESDTSLRLRRQQCTGSG